MSLVRSDVSEELRGLFGGFFASICVLRRRSLGAGRTAPQQEKPFVTVHFSQRIKPQRSETSKLPEIIHHTGAVICGCHRICFIYLFIYFYALNSLCPFWCARAKMRSRK